MPQKRKAPKRRKAKRRRRAGGLSKAPANKKKSGWVKKTVLGAMGIGTLALALTGAKVANSGVGKFIGRNAAQRARYRVPQHWGSRWN